MPKINVLDKHTAELIAAGEVVERPASVVKELLENSIDSGATVITVEIQQGGISYIRITDNGCGIERDDVAKAFLRHATSKVRTENDLEQIGTLGFRGEALPSIAAVSRVDMLTKSAGEQIGTRYVIEGSEQVSLDDAGCPEGTTVIVRDIFYNTPARMKFLKKNVSEANAVADVLDRLALSHPEVSFRFIRDGKETLLTPGDGRLISAIHAVYGKEFTSSLIPVEYSEFGLSVSGYISKPVYSRATRAMQNFFVNGRFIKTGTGAAALNEAYKNSIMAGKFPACVLQITIPLGAVDANVHPAKTEIRFSSEKTVFDLIYYAVKTALEKGDTRVDIALKPSAPAPVYKPFTYEPAKKYENKPAHVQTVINSSFKNTPENGGLHESGGMYNKNIMLGVNGYNAEIAASYEIADKSDAAITKKSSEVTDIINDKASGFGGKKQPEDYKIYTAKKEEIQSETAFLPRQNIEIPQKEQSLQTIKIIGEAFNTYIMAEVNERVLIIDKHAAHERILFDRLRNEYSLGDAQMLISPVRVTLSKNQYGAMVASKEKLQKAGIIIDDFGGTDLMVRSVPLLTETSDIASFTEEISERLLQNKDVTTEYIDWVFHSVACRAAVKAGDNSDIKEIEALAKRILNDDSIRYCPHGRPVAVWLSKKELEKQFGRI